MTWPWWLAWGGAAVSLGAAAGIAERRDRYGLATTLNAALSILYLVAAVVVSSGWISVIWWTSTAVFMLWTLVSLLLNLISWRWRRHHVCNEDCPGWVMYSKEIR